VVLTFLIAKRICTAWEDEQGGLVGHKTHFQVRIIDPIQAKQAIFDDDQLEVLASGIPAEPDRSRDELYQKRIESRSAREGFMFR
jgi:hypothetical protein